MFAVQILTKNNERTIQDTLETLQPLRPKILVGDYNSTDRTRQILNQYQCEVMLLDNQPRDWARNQLTEKYPDANWLMIEPWEVLVKGHKQILEARNPSFVSILQNQTLSKDIRVWKGKRLFRNPVFETLDTKSEAEVDALLYSKGSHDPHIQLAAVDLWKSERPLEIDPYYFQANLFMTIGRYDEFLHAAEHYLFLNKTEKMSTTMMRYYFAMVQILVKKRAKPALQNLNLCMCHKPLMAEFWCLTGDVYYHLLNDFEKARDFYENAIILGARRLKTDKWPMDIPKYKQYPERMIKSCENLKEATMVFATKYRSPK